MATNAALLAETTRCWAKCEILPARLAEVTAVGKRLVAPDAKAVYQHISQAVWNTPDRWWFVAIVHEREASQNFNCSIAQGDPWNAVSTHKPRGIGPFKDFISAAIFALTRCAPYPAKWTDWSIPGVLVLFIQYNGTGYEDYHHEVSPYDWGATTMEEEGKYVADSKWSGTVWDTQVGCAAMLKAMMTLDPSIQFPTVAATTVAPTAVPKPAPVSPTVPPAKPPSNAGKLAAVGVIGSLVAFGLGHLNATLHNAPPPAVQSAPVPATGGNGSVPPASVAAPAPAPKPIEAPPLPPPRPMQAGDEAIACAVIRYLAPFVSDDQKHLFAKNMKLTSEQTSAVTRCFQ